jgi:hypothetical protein
MEGLLFISATAFRLALGPTQSAIRWVPAALPLQIMRPGREADHSPKSDVEIKNACSCTSTHPYVFMTWGVVTYRDFTFTLRSAGLPNTGTDWVSSPIPLGPRDKLKSLCLMHFEVRSHPDVQPPAVPMNKAQKNIRSNRTYDVMVLVSDTLHTVRYTPIQFNN